MPKPSFKMMAIKWVDEDGTGHRELVINEEQVKAHLADIADPTASNPDKAWNEGFVSGLDAAGVLTSEQYYDLMDFVDNM